MLAMMPMITTTTQQLEQREARSAAGRPPRGRPLLDFQLPMSASGSFAARLAVGTSVVTVDLAARAGEM